MPDLLGRSLTAVTISFLLPYSHAGIFVSCLSCCNLACWYPLLSFPALAFVACWRAWMEPEAVPAASCWKGEAAVQGLHLIPTVCRTRIPWMPEGWCCSPTGAAFSTAWEELLHCWLLYSYSGGKAGCHQNQAADAEARAKWAAPVPAGLPPASGSPLTQWLSALLRDVGSDVYRAGGWNWAVLTREPYVGWGGFL